jgi:uncharacterized protein YprB with RNaseH-like and TPR domain
MALRDKLSRLGPGAPLSRSERTAAPALPVETASAALPGVEEPAAAPAAERQDVLDELRAKMQALLGKERPVPAPRSKASLAELPFVDAEHRGLRLTQRLERLPPSAHVGRIPIDAARTASSEMLALLGLDPTLAGCDFSRALYLDTETTGLGGSGVVAFLVGLLWFDDDGCPRLEQLLLREPGDEKALLERLCELVERSSLLVTYNGKSFDLPLLAARRVMNRLPALPPRPHFDLLHVARRLHKQRLGACRLIHLESHVLGWERGEDDIPGAEIAPRYGHFLRTGDGEALRPVVDHNAWDVVSMAALVGLYGEQLPNLHSEDLVGVARTLRKARAFEQALSVADVALERGAGALGLRARGEIAKARGDKARALADFEALSAEVDDPWVRLELAKLYEHHAGDAQRALALLDAGTGESDDAVVKRRTRLQKKLERGRLG